MSHRSRTITAGLLLLLAGWGFHHFFSSPTVANSPPPNDKIIAFGDSLTQGVGASPDQTYPDQLAGLLGRPIINAGVAGETAEDALRRLQRDVLAEKPGTVIVLLGGNDLLQRHDPDKAFAALDAIVLRCAASGAMVVLVGIEGLPLLTENYGKRFKKLARDRQCLYVPDILGGIMGKPEWMSDGVHPNSKGYAIMAEKISKAIKPHLAN